MRQVFISRCCAEVRQLWGRAHMRRLVAAVAVVVLYAIAYAALVRPTAGAGVYTATDELQSALQTFFHDLDAHNPDAHEITHDYFQIVGDFCFFLFLGLGIWKHQSDVCDALVVVVVNALRSTVSLTAQHGTLAHNQWWSVLAWDPDVSITTSVTLLFIALRRLRREMRSIFVHWFTHLTFVLFVVYLLAVRQTHVNGVFAALLLPLVLPLVRERIQDAVVQVRIGKTTRDTHLHLPEYSDDVDLD